MLHLALTKVRSGKASIILFILETCRSDGGVQIIFVRGEEGLLYLKNDGVFISMTIKYAKLKLNR